MAITLRRKIDSCLLILTEESYINKESEKQLRFRYDQFISICCCGIESVRSKAVSFESSFDQNQRLVHREKSLLDKTFSFSFILLNFSIFFFADKFHCVYKHHLSVPKIYHCNI